MSANRERLLNQLSTVATCLRGIAGIHSNDSMPGTCSLDRKDIEELSPACITDGFGKGMIFDHIADAQILSGNEAMSICIVLSNLEMKITALTANLQMRLGCILGSLAASVAAFLTTTQLPLLAPKRLLQGAIVAWVLYRATLGIRKEHFQAYINTDVRMLTGGWNMLGLWLYLADNESIPMSISTQDEMHRLGSALYRAVQLDLEEVPDLLRDNEVFLVFMQIAVFAILPQLNGVPTVRLLKAGKPDTRNVRLLGREKPLERLGEPISEHLYSCGWDMFTLSFECYLKIILRGKRLLLLILCFDLLKHGIIDTTRFNQALHKQRGLGFIWIEAIFKCSHGHMLLQSMSMCQVPPAGGNSPTWLKPVALLPQFW